jgi:hypothetical protein
MTSIYPPIDPPKNGKAGSFYTFEFVEQQLVEAMGLWRRSPGGGKWPFAGDGPWHLVRDDGTAQAEWDHRVNAHKMGETERPRPLPLTRAQIAERDSISEWLRFVPDRDRKLVILALTELANGQKRIRWSEIRRRLGSGIQAQSLGKRYSRAIGRIAQSLNSADFCADGVSRQMVNNVENKVCTPSAS